MNVIARQHIKAVSKHCFAVLPPQNVVDKSASLPAMLLGGAMTVRFEL